MATQLEQIVANLSVSASELKGWMGIVNGDAASVKLLNDGWDLVTELRDKYASAGEPIDPLAAQELREFSDKMKTVGKGTRAEEGLSFEADRISQAMMFAGTGLDSQNRFIFVSPIE